MMNAEKVISLKNCVAGPPLLDCMTNLTCPKPKSNGWNENFDDS